MTPERWARIEELFHKARALPPVDRGAFLDAACADDVSIRRNVESLLDDSASDDGFLVSPAPAMAAQLVTDPVPMTRVGVCLGVYQLQALIGAGGMGEVYRARDTRLERDVAIKILPAAFTSNPDRLARFEREARMLAALNHPNICAIYGLEEADGLRFLVLELVEGDTLAASVAQTRDPQGAATGLPLGRALTIARQIADALEFAHERGIIHRDLKPANINITADGVVKVLDFGLAKVVKGDVASDGLTERVTVDTHVGAVVGTAAYMSPEQARGLPVDKRTDIWAFGCVLYEMLTGRTTFAGDTASDSIARILEREPDWSRLPAATPAPIQRLLLRCLTKDPKRRLRDIGDVRIELDAIDEALPGAAAMPLPPASVRSRTPWLPWAALAAVAMAWAAWEALGPAAAMPNPLANATFSRVTNWEGTEEHAELSPDGRFVAFLADKAGQLDVWVSQVGTGTFDNLTTDLPPMLTPGNLLRSLGFSGNGSEIWFSRNGNPAGQQVLVPLTGGTPRPFLARGRSAPAWSPDDTRLVYIGSIGEPAGDPMSLADRTGADPQLIGVPDQGREAFVRKGVHTHNPVWSPDGEWIYFVHGTDPFGDMDIWRMRPSGESPERLTHQNAPVNYLAPLDARTLLYVARAEDWSGPWLWSLDVESKGTRRVTVGLEQYTSVSASRDGRRIVATVADPSASLWRVPILDRLVEERDAQPFPVQTERALAPRFAGETLFFLSLAARGTGDGLWSIRNGQTFEVRRGADGVLSEPPAASRDGSQVAVVVRQQGKKRLAVLSADGTNSRMLAPSIEVKGVAGQGMADWSPDGAWIVAGGDNGQGEGLFKIPLDGGEPVRLVTGEARGPLWSPNGDLIVYATPSGEIGGLDALRGVRPDGTPVQLPEVRVRMGGAHRFLRNGVGLVYLPDVESKDFWLVDLTTSTVRQLTDLRDRGYLNTFDITPDGNYLVFDRTRQNSDVVLIDRPEP